MCSLTERKLLRLPVAARAPRPVRIDRRVQGGQHRDAELAGAAQGQAVQAVIRDDVELV